MKITPTPAEKVTPGSVLAFGDARHDGPPPGRATVKSGPHPVTSTLVTFVTEDADGNPGEWLARRGESLNVVTE